MMTYATVEDLAAGWNGWNDLSDDEQSVAETMLQRASSHLELLMNRHHVAIDPSDKLQVENIKTVVCNMVRRVMSPGYEGVSSFAQSVGSTNVSISYRPDDGGFWLTRDEKGLLGITGRGKMMMLRPAIHNYDGTLVDGW